MEIQKKKVRKLNWVDCLLPSTYHSLLLTVVFCLLTVHSQAQTDSLYRIGLILPFQTSSTIEKLEAYSGAHDLATAHKVRLSEDAVMSLEFYQGILQSLSESKDSFKIELSVYDNWNSDSVTAEILKKPELKKLNILIGSVSTSSAKLVADYCKQNKLVNIQPFTPSKSLTTENPYHLKIAPTIDAHADAMFNSIVDSFPGANIVIYTPGAEINLNTAQRFDSLFSSYSKPATRKFTTTFLNTKTMLVNGKKTTASEQLKDGKQNIVIITSFDESFVNGNLRVLHEQLAKDSTIIVYGMPTWLNGDILRLDYVNDFNTRLTDAFFTDKWKKQTQDFELNYKTNFDTEPTRYSFLGYDVMNFTLSNLSDYGKDFLDYVSTQHYNGTAFKFDIAKNNKNETTVNYFENRFVNVFQVQNYQLKKVW